MTQSSGSYVTEAVDTIQQSWHITAQLTGELLSQNGSNEDSVFMPGMAPWSYMVKLRFHMISTKLFILFTLLYFFSWVCLTLLWVTQEYQWYLTRFSQSNNKRIQQVRTDGKELFAHLTYLELMRADEGILAQHFILQDHIQTLYTSQPLNGVLVQHFVLKSNTLTINLCKTTLFVHIF